jgi:hypothetical protein
MPHSLHEPFRSDHHPHPRTRHRLAPLPIRRPPLDRPPHPRPDRRCRGTRRRRRRPHTAQSLIHSGTGSPGPRHPRHLFQDSQSRLHFLRHCHCRTASLDQPPQFFLDFLADHSATSHPRTHRIPRSRRQIRRRLPRIQIPHVVLILLLVVLSVRARRPHRFPATTDELLREIQRDLDQKPDRGAIVPALGGVWRGSQIPAEAREDVADSATCISTSKIGTAFTC